MTLNKYVIFGAIALLLVLFVFQSYATAEQVESSDSTQTTEKSCTSCCGDNCGSCCSGGTCSRQSTQGVKSSCGCQ